jgi:uroporphyrinogen III methyltransferase/synthase
VSPWSDNLSISRINLQNRLPAEQTMQIARVYLVGAGPGAPELLTIRGLEVLRQAEVVIYDRLVNPVLLREAPQESIRISAGKHPGNHSLPQEQIIALLIAHARRGRRVVRLKGGDPFVFGRGGEEALALAEAGIPFEIVPGVSSAIAAPAFAGIPLTYRHLSSSFAVVTGHEGPCKDRPAVDWPRLATAVDTLVVLMGVNTLPSVVRELLAHGRPSRTPVALIRWATTDGQETLVGCLGDIAGKAHAAGLEPPVVAVIGDVVGLRNRLRWFDHLPVVGLRKPAPPASDERGDHLRPWHMAPPCGQKAMSSLSPSMASTAEDVL